MIQRRRLEYVLLIAIVPSRPFPLWIPAFAGMTVWEGWKTVLHQSDGYGRDGKPAFAGLTMAEAGRFTLNEPFSR